jgi:sugar/nucleoside kinase (ribokinase family)
VSDRHGIASGGNWIVDRVKTVDTLPGRGMLANIRSEEAATGGAPANVLMDLARLEAGFPLTGLGVIGNDEDGEFILEKAGEVGVDMSLITRSDQAPTSYTDVMNETGSGERQFFHNRGANALFGPEHVPADSLGCRIFHLGYLLLLDRLDESDAEFGTVAARLLHDLRAAGIKTSVDVVSEESDRFTLLVPPALKHTDYLILNEIEAGRTTGYKVRGENGALDAEALADAADVLCESGTMELLVVHMPEGFYGRDRDGRRFSRGSFELPAGFIQGSTGAGDAFCAGVLYGLHEGMEPAEAGHLGTGCAAGCLSAPNATDGLRPLPQVRKLMDSLTEYDPPVVV